MKRSKFLHFAKISPSLTLTLTLTLTLNLQELDIQTLTHWSLRKDDTP